ncbi:MAG TPA: hypothetical protein DHV28_18685 [Ignavibacteriales bacterium]|nr:hypothetical protein [Ignavibacteriales bacterium]
MIRMSVCLSFLLIVVASFVSCSKDENIVDTSRGNSSITGILKFLDNTPASLATIELKSNASQRSIYQTCNSNGDFSFGLLNKGDYTLIFRSTSYDINSTYTAVTLDDNQNLSRDVFVRYNMLDDFATKIISQDVFLIKMHPDGARVGNNYNLINSLSGYYRSGESDSVTLSADVYLVPENIDWNNPGVDLTPEFISSNFQFLFSMDEEAVINGRHEIKIPPSNIQEMFSNPVNGFAFVKRDSVANVLKILCVDFANNDFGLKIFYK